ncbi:endonuclease/exonuclease/phosphatase family protein [Geodermatophilus sp. SYSU D00742]
MNVEVATFNAMNLARPGERFYANEEPYSQDEYDQKANWTATQLRQMQADVVGFQEVFHEEALRDVCDRSKSFDGATVVAPGADGVSGPRLGLASRLSLDGPISTVVDFPAGVHATVDGVTLPVGTFSRPVVRARLVLDSAKGTTTTVFVVHLKSKRPIRDPQAPEHDPREEALGKARALIRRAAEAVALRFLVLDEIMGNAEPVIVLGDLNDAARAVSTDIVMGDAPSRSWPKSAGDRKGYVDRLLYSTYELNAQQVGRDVSYTHIFNGRYENLDHILVSQEFHDRNPQRIGDVINLRYFNDHLVDSQLSDDRSARVASDHGQLVAEIRLR